MGLVWALKPKSKVLSCDWFLAPSRFRFFMDGLGLWR